MWPLFLSSIVLGIMSLRGIRWAYIAFILVGLLYFPLSVGFQLNPRACQFGFNLRLVRLSLTNYPHIVLFALFFMMTSAQLRRDKLSGFVIAALGTLVMGALVEAAEGITGNGNCRLRDLVPDAAGALLGATAVFLLAQRRPKTWLF